jgi:hypothetical protein
MHFGVFHVCYPPTVALHALGPLAGRNNKARQRSMASWNLRSKKKQARIAEYLGTSRGVLEGTSPPGLGKGAPADRDTAIRKVGLEISALQQPSVFGELAV